VLADAFLLGSINIACSDANDEQMTHSIQLALENKIKTYTIQIHGPLKFLQLPHHNHGTTFTTTAPQPQHHNHSTTTTAQDLPENLKYSSKPSRNVLPKFSEESSSENPHLLLTTSTSIDMATAFGTGPPNHFVTPIQALSTHGSAALASACNKTAADLVSIVTASANPTSDLWQLWEAFFLGAIVSESPYAPQFALLDALRAQLPTQPTNVVAGSLEEIQLNNYTESDGQLHWSKLPGFDCQWRDEYDALESFRDWDRPSGDPTGNSLGISDGEYFLRFCRFSAALLKATHGEADVHPIQVFYTTRNVLESKGPKPKKEEGHTLTAEQLWSLDICAATTWLLGGGRALWETDYGFLREHYWESLDSKTELWPREDGLTAERWRLWEERLRALSTEDGSLDEKVRAEAIRAADEIKSILEEKLG
jgi:hypothetical protein